MLLNTRKPTTTGIPLLSKCEPMIVAMPIARMVLTELKSEEAEPAMWPMGSNANEVILPNKKAKLNMTIDI